METKPKNTNKKEEITTTARIKSSENQHKIGELVEKAASSRTHIQTLMHLAHVDNLLVHRALIDNHKTPSEALHKLARSEDDFVKLGVTKHINTAIDTLVMLSKSEKSHIAKQATSHPTYQIYNSFFAAL